MTAAPPRASCVYDGVVVHRRRTPREHAFRYRMFLVYLDLDELPELFDGVPMWSARRPAPAWFRRVDYLGDPATPLAEAVRDLIAERLGERPPGPVRMLTNLRYLGHCSNPVSFYWCFDADGRRVTHVAAEVTNTPWGERHAYVSSELVSRHPKQLHVSPFWPMRMEYELRVGIPGERLQVAIGADQDGKRAFDAAMSLRRREITPALLASLLLSRLPMTLKVSAAIYGEALRLRVKGVRPYRHPRRAA
jgi:DUF1365 family protein